MTYKVSISSGYNYSAKLSQPLNYKTSLSYDIEIMPQTLDELTDVEISGTNDKYVLMYDANIQRIKFVNPDEVLNAAAETETTQPGLVGFTTSFLNELDINLDNKIDIDGGQF